MVLLFKDKALRELVEKIAGMKGVEKIILYGSVARGNYSHDSDVDIIIIGEPDRNIIYDVASDLLGKYGIVMSIIILPPYMMNRDTPFIREVKRGITLWTKKS